MITKTKNISVQDDIKHAIAWLKKEYPRGVDLIYVDYRDCFEDETKLQTVLKEGYYDDELMWESEHSTIRDIIANYTKKGYVDFQEISEEVEEAMGNWLMEHDTSDALVSLLKNTGNKLFYIETEDSTESYDSMEKEEYQDQIAGLMKKYAKTDEEKKEISRVMGEQFYGAPVSFYFYADVMDVFASLHRQKGKYIEVKGAYFSTIDRVQGSNWLGDNGIFTLTIPKEDFIKNVYLDKAKGNGYGWDSIAGQTGYDEATVTCTDKKAEGTVFLESTATSEAQAREARLQENWDKTGKCTLGDMNWDRHTGKKAYRNEYPCGNTCEDCGTFWID